MSERRTADTFDFQICFAYPLVKNDRNSREEKSEEKIKNNVETKGHARESDQEGVELGIELHQESTRLTTLIGGNWQLPVQDVDFERVHFLTRYFSSTQQVYLQK